MLFRSKRLGLELRPQDIVTVPIFVEPARQVFQRYLDTTLFHLPDSSSLMDSRDYIKPLSGIGTQVHTLRAIIGFQIAVLDDLPFMPPDFTILLVVPVNRILLVAFIGNRESSFTGGLNNTLTWKNFTFNMLWEFRVGGDVVNGTQYAMDNSGVSQFSADVRNRSLTVTGVNANGDPVTNTWEADKTYTFNGVQMSGYNIIKDYYQNYYSKESANYITDVNSLRLRSVSLSYEFPKTWLSKIGFVKQIGRASCRERV